MPIVSCHSLVFYRNSKNKARKRNLLYSFAVQFFRWPDVFTTQVNEGKLILLARGSCRRPSYKQGSEELIRYCKSSVHESVGLGYELINQLAYPPNRPKSKCYLKTGSVV